MNNSNYTTLGVDLANYNFHDDVINDRRPIVKRGQLSRSMLLEQLSKMQIDKIAMEVCGTVLLLGSAVDAVESECRFYTSAQTQT